MARQRTRRIGFERSDLALENRAARRVFVAKIDVDLVDADRPRGDQRALEEAVRIALEVVAILERARLALVDVHREQPRRGLGAHDFPLAARRKARAPQTAQAGCFERRDDVLDRALAAHARVKDAVAAVGAIGGIVVVARDVGREASGGNGRRDGFRRRAIDRLAPHDRRGRVLAAADAWRVDDPHVRPTASLDLGVQCRRPRQRAGQRLAHAHGDLGRWRFALLHHVEVVVEGGDLVDLGRRELELIGQATRWAADR